jgi:hypothetical protein
MKQLKLKVARRNSRYQDLKPGQLFMLANSETGKLFKDMEIYLKTKDNGMLCYSKPGSISVWGDGYCVSTRSGGVAGHFDDSDPVRIVSIK